MIEADRERREGEGECDAPNASSLPVSALCSSVRVKASVFPASDLRIVSVPGEMAADYVAARARPARGRPRVAPRSGSETRDARRTHVDDLALDSDLLAEFRPSDEPARGGCRASATPRPRAPPRARSTLSRSLAQRTSQAGG